MATEKKRFQIQTETLETNRFFFLNFTAYINNEQDGAVGDTDALKGD